MKKENMSGEDLYLTPEEKDRDMIAQYDNFEPEADHFTSNADTSENTHKPVRMKEISECRGSNFKVFSMSDGSKQAVFSPSAIHFFDDETHAFEDIENTLTEDEDGKHITCGKNRFVAKFSCEQDNDDIFSIEEGMHKITVYARKNRKNKKMGVKPNLRKNAEEGIRRSDILTFENIEPDTDYEYSVEGSGVKENIIVKKPSAVYRYPFALRCENLTAQFDESSKSIAFLSNESGEEIFSIPAPFMIDANGVTSDAVDFELKTNNSGMLLLTVTADADWMNSEQRAFPVTIDPQIRAGGSLAMTTYSWQNGSVYNSSVHEIGTCSNGNEICKVNRMYVHLRMPTLPRNPRIKKAELTFYQKSTVINEFPYPKLGLYYVNENISCGTNTPQNDTRLIDYAVMNIPEGINNPTITYTFDITSLFDRANKGEISTVNLVMKMLSEENYPNTRLSLYGSSNTSYKPQLLITYESSYGVNTSYRTHTHELGRFGQGSVDLQCGNLMFESEDFAWGGNRMPVTIKHLFNSALSEYAYTQNSSIGLKTADFSDMKLGYGFKLNLMQSMISTYFIHEGTSYNGYVYVDENGEESYFKLSTKTAKCESNSQCYNLYEDVNDENIIYDPKKRTLTQGDDTYLFDSSGRLIRITDAYNHMDITYTSNRITSVTDGAGRDFGFAYNASGQLTSITAPDGTYITYSYTSDRLTSVIYPDGKKAVISYASNKPESVTLCDANGAQVYRVDYDFYRDCLVGVEGYGSDNSFETGTVYLYYAASSKTVASTLEEDDDGSENLITTTYTFDDDGNVISEYVYTSDTEKTGVSNDGSGINPHSGDGGAGIVRNINNLLRGHSFESLKSWINTPSCSSDFQLSLFENESSAKFGKNILRMQSNDTECTANGIYQITNSLPAGQYTFSVYARVYNISGTNAGAYIRVLDNNGCVIATSEKLTVCDYHFVRLILPFELSSPQPVEVQILVDGKCSIYADAAQLESNPYANDYNILENGNFERTGNNGVWTLSAGASYSELNCFDMSKSLCINGSIATARYAYQVPVVCTSRSTRETFTLSGWAKGYGLPNHERYGAVSPKFRLRAVIRYSNSSSTDYSEEFTADFSPCTEEWQFASVQFSKTQYKPIYDITVYCEYNYNSGTVYFDNIQLIRNSLEKELSAEDFVSGDNDTSENAVEENSETSDFKEARDAYGNTLTETTFDDNEFGTIYRAFKFNEDNSLMSGDDSGNNLIEETDARGNKTTYTVDGETSRNEKVTDRLGNKTEYEYDDSGRVTKVTSKDANDTELANVSYAYDTFDNMTEIVRGDGMKYALAYNAFHNLESIGIDGKTEKLISYAYKNGSSRLKQMTYASGDTMKATYNSIGQMVAETWYDSNNVEIARYKYVYDSEGNIVRSIDIHAEKEYNYVYEEGRIVRATELDIALSGDIVTERTLVNTIRYYYNSENNLASKITTPAAGSAHVVRYETNGDSTIVRFDVPANDDENPYRKQTITSRSKSDSFGRKVFDELQLGTSFVYRQLHYHEGEVTDLHKSINKLKSSPTTQLVSQIVFSGGRTISYEYDAEERITKVTDSIEGITEYTYDALGQLQTETVNGEVVNSMTYDNYGNIIGKNNKQYCYDETWHDLLTCYDGQCNIYDAQGNPTYYLGHNLTWEKGRQLKSFDGNTYTYNANGIRTSKTVNGVKHTYTLDGTKILREVWGDNTLIPLYDNEESICGIIYNDTPFYFQKNLQGDVIAIVDKDAQTVARYSYDAWGVPEVKFDSSECQIATINPFRYRGYYYDDEIELYYLQSRYYNAGVGRFINTDDMVLHFSTLAAGLYTPWHYCYNDPVNSSDDCGYASSSIKDKIKSYTKESWIAWIMNKFINKVTPNGRLDLIKFNKLGLEMQLFLQIATKKGYKKPSKSSIEASFKGVSFKLAWGGKLDATLGLTIEKHTVSFMRGIDWKKSYFSVLISSVTKDGRIEFTSGLYVSVAHLLKLAIAVTVAGACVVLPALAPAFMSSVTALSAKAKALVSICTAILNGLQYLPA